MTHAVIFQRIAGVYVQKKVGGEQHALAHTSAQYVLPREARAHSRLAVMALPGTTNMGQHGT